MVRYVYSWTLMPAVWIDCIQCLLMKSVLPSSNRTKRTGFLMRKHILLAFKRYWFEPQLVYMLFRFEVFYMVLQSSDSRWMSSDCDHLFSQSLHTSIFWAVSISLNNEPTNQLNKCVKLCKLILSMYVTSLVTVIWVTKKKIISNTVNLG
jgi:hypothetical protein